jgi:hypothetical protein
MGKYSLAAILCASSSEKNTQGDKIRTKTNRYAKCVISLAFCQSCNSFTKNRGTRTQEFSTDDSRDHHSTRSSVSPIFPASKAISITFISMLFPISFRPSELQASKSLPHKIPTYFASCMNYMSNLLHFITLQRYVKNTYHGIRNPVMSLIHFKLFSLTLIVSRDSAVGIATGYELDD